MSACRRGERMAPAFERDHPTLRLDPLGERDLPALTSLVRAYYEEDGLDWVEERQPAALRALAAGDPNGRGWMIRLGGRAVGYAVLTWSFSIESGGRDGLIDEIYLVPEVRGRGLGRRALAMIEDEARTLGLRRLFLEVNHGNRALSLYRRAGFVDHRRYLMSKFI